MPNTCIVCGHTKAKALGETKHVSLFRFPADQTRREQWLKALGPKSSDITLLARIEYLEAENQKLKDITSKTQPKHFRLEDDANDDSLIRFYTGFPSYEIFLFVFDFLGPAVNKLHY